MKKTLLIVLASAAIYVPVYAQSTGQVAERFRSLINTKQSDWNEKINYSSINKAIMKKTIFMATIITAAMAVNAQTANKDEQAVSKIISTLETGWNNKSGETFSSVFADVHDYIVVNGMYFPNWTKKGNETAHQGLFNSIFKNHILTLKVDKVSFFRPDLAQAIVIGGGYEKGGTLPENPAIIMTIIAEKKNETWKIISFHNHEFNAAELKQRSPMPLEVMYASWYKK